MKKILCLIIIAAVVYAIPKPIWMLQMSKEMASDKSTRTIVIDPGHGGIDGGAEGRDGTPEKNINLAISLFLREALVKEGFDVAMTREEDVGLYLQDGSGIRSKKTQDIKRRQEIIDEIEPCLTVSIHLNSFPQDGNVYGAQVFYPKKASQEKVAKRSQKIAETVQKSLASKLEDHGKRSAMGKDDIYLFKEPKYAIILVECGFLSNYEEGNMLKTVKYQQKIAKAISTGIVKAIGKKGNHEE